MILGVVVELDEAAEWEDRQAICQPLYEAGVEVFFAGVDDCGEGAVDYVGFAVRARVAQGFIHVRESDDPSKFVNLIASQPVGIAATVVALVYLHGDSADPGLVGAEALDHRFGLVRVVAQ